MTRSTIAFQTSKQILLNFSHRKALAYSFPSVIRPLVNFRENYFLRDTSQVILVLMIPVSSFYHVGGPRKRVVRHTDRQKDRQRDRFWILLYKYNISLLMLVNFHFKSFTLVVQYVITVITSLTQGSGNESLRLKHSLFVMKV